MSEPSSPWGRRSRPWASTDLNCSDFRYQQDAQAVFNADRSDPNGLDRDGDKVAGSSLPHRPAGTGTGTTTRTGTTTPAPATTPDPTAIPSPTATSTVATTTPGTTTPAAITSPTTGPTTTAAAERDCAIQTDAQAFLTADPTDPSGLDADHDGVACEASFGTQNQQVAVFPNGAVHTGGFPLR